MYHFLKVKIAIIADCMKIFRFCKGYTVTYYTQINVQHLSMIKLFLICLQVPNQCRQKVYVYVELRLVSSWSWTWNKYEACQC